MQIYIKNVKKQNKILNFFKTFLGTIKLISF